jgi:LDH2 family malate/lactate/ureidoglycolate dehydrogenase
VDAADAAVVADVLVAADLRGIESHGVARLESYYVSRLRKDLMAPRPTVTTLRETPSSLVLDAGNGLGHPVSKHAMEQVIEKAKASGSAFAAVRNSNHYGIAGYYAMMALEHDMIGIASTNTVRYGAPTYGSDMLLGTNPFPTRSRPGTNPRSCSTSRRRPCRAARSKSICARRSRSTTAGRSTPRGTRRPIPPPR